MTSKTKTQGKLNKFERFKAEKDGLSVKDELEKFADMGWEAVDETDLKQRLKWLGVFFRPVTPGKFMLRMRVPNGVVTSEQMQVLGEIVQRYGDDGNADITTRQNLQLRGIRLEDVPDIFRRFEKVDLTSVQSGMDNVRNLTGSPVAGIDADELYDTRELVKQVQDMITGDGAGNYEFTNLPRKFNIAIAGGRDNSVHAEINDIAYIPAFKNGDFGFNVLVGGFFSAKRCAAAVPLNAWVKPDRVVALSRAILEVYRDNGLRANRQKSRLMWLIDEWGIEKFRAEVERQLGESLEPEAETDEITWDKRDHIGVHAQKQSGLNYVGLHIPIGRLYAPDMFELARLAEVYGSGEIRLTVEQNAIISDIPDERLEAFLAEPLLERFTIDPAPLTRSLVSCTGSQFCNFALIETKNRALAMVEELETEIDIPESVRIHWTGCPNSCGQPQVADIGLMGTKARKDGNIVEGVDIYMGGKVGKDAELGERVDKSIPCEDLKPYLRKLLVDNFGAALKEGVSLEEPMPSDEPSGPSSPPATVVFRKSGKEVSCFEEDFILEVAEREGVEIDSSCRAGVCGTCQAAIVEGDIKYDAEPDALGGLESGLVLTCSAHPVGKVVIDA